jgi:hypothetical protein
MRRLSAILSDNGENQAQGRGTQQEKLSGFQGAARP